MEIRKFIVTVHEDGSISAVEYIPPEDQALANYQAGCKETRTRIEHMLRYEIGRAKHNASLQDFGPLWKDTWLTKATAYEYILEKIRQTILN